jgi:hypothetical protein
MQQLSEPRARSSLGKALGSIAVALLCATALSQPNLAYAHGGGGGGGGGGGFHGGGGGGGFHGGGFHGGGGGMHNGFHGGFHGGFHEGFHEGFHGFRDGDHFRGFRDRDHFRRFGRGVGVYYGYGYYPYDSYYDPGQYSSSSMWYYCSDPAGYYPYITQCDTGWQTVPGS